MPARALLEAIRAFLPGEGARPRAPGRGGFARVTLTTCRRAAGVAWSDAIFVEANAGIWPGRREPSCWLGDEARRELNGSGRFSLGLATSDDRAALERRLISAIARDTRRTVVLSAALYGEEEPEVRLGPNAWLERVMWSKGLLSADGAGRRRSRGWPSRRAARTGGATGAGAAGALARASGAGAGTRRSPFDEFFLAGPIRGAQAREPFGARRSRAGSWTRPGSGSMRSCGCGGSSGGPSERERGKAVGDAVHRALAAALRGAPAEGDFFRAAGPGCGRGEARRGARGPSRAGGRRTATGIRSTWTCAGRPGSCWAACTSFPRPLRRGGGCGCPSGATVPAGDAGPVPVPRPGGPGAFRPAAAGRARGSRSSTTRPGPGRRSRRRRMASTGAALQLGVYLQAALSAGASGGVWMLKPEEPPRRIGAEELDLACAKLEDHRRAPLDGDLRRADARPGRVHPRIRVAARVRADRARRSWRRKFARTFGLPAAGRTGERRRWLSGRPTRPRGSDSRTSGA